MSAVKDLNCVNDYCELFGLSALHPLVSVIDLSEGKWRELGHTDAVRYNFYAVFLKQGANCILKYGRKNYDYQDGTLVFVGPGQLVNVSQVDTSTPPAGYALLFHPDLLRSTNLGKSMSKYSFFSYELNEALHLSLRERQIVMDCFDKVHYELSQNIDKHSRTLLVSNIELFLNYCIRFYDRQFITRDIVHVGIVEAFEKAIETYLQSGKALEAGPPSVRYFADELSLSANYFGDLIKKETGKSAIEYIQDKIIALAKQRIFDPQSSISEIAYELGFKYPQHFTRFFKSKVGCSPSEYRRSN